MTNMFVGMGSHPTVRRKGYTLQYDLFYDMRTNSAENVLVWY